MSLKLDDVALIGRTFAEYLKIFNLNEDNLNDKKILDIASGVSSFCAEANLKEIDVVAVDKIYSFDVKKLKEKSKNGVARNLFLYDYENNLEHYKIANLPKINFKSNSFDLALISNLVDYNKIILEALRVSKEVRIFSSISLENLENSSDFKNFQIIKKENLLIIKKEIK